MNHPRIALIRQRWNPFGGAERFVSRALDALRTQGASVTLVTRSWKGEGDALVVNPFYLGNVWRDWGFARATCQALEKADFDLVQAHERIACCDVYRAGDGVHREWLQQRRRILSGWQRFNLDLNPYHHYVLRAEKKLFTSPHLKAVICNSRMVKEEIRKWFGLPEEKLHVIYSGIDCTAFAPLDTDRRNAFRRSQGMPVDAFVFLFVGSGFGRKGLANAIHALAKQPPNCHLWVLGEDRFLSRHEKLAATLGLGYRVRFMGGQQDVKPWYGAADAFVLPTHYDPFPNAALEAWASGLPVLTSFKSGAAELVREGINGHVRDALDVDGLADAMHATLARGPGADRIASRETVANLVPEAMAEQLLSLYRSLLAARMPVEPDA